MIMKFMGSKRWMLENGLGRLLDTAAPRSGRFVDLFSGSVAVGTFVATRHGIKVVANDLQQFSASLARATLCRTTPLDAAKVCTAWFDAAKNVVDCTSGIPEVEKITRHAVTHAREWCERRPARFVITRAYGGHYFAPKQSIWIDALLNTLPDNQIEHMVAKAAVIVAASRCAAAPGHTAQPFQPTRAARQFLADAWKRNVLAYTERALTDVCLRHARVLGEALVEDAQVVAGKLRHTDLVFIDPPYSGVHYSRFYHVLETIACGACGPVDGVGRYPASELRPKSTFSLKTASEDAMEQLLATIASRGASAILTFPDHACSNGLSGESLCEIAREYFYVREKRVVSTFSTLGGPGEANDNEERPRGARRPACELILSLSPRD